MTKVVHRTDPLNVDADHTLTRCCKDERQSQWGMAKFDPQPTLNPLTDRHQISSICAAGYQPMAIATKTVKSELAKPAACLESYKMYGGTNTST